MIFKGENKIFYNDFKLKDKNKNKICFEVKECADNRDWQRFRKIFSSIEIQEGYIITKNFPDKKLVDTSGIILAQDI